jgi:predicted transcriptional regulator
MKGIRESGFFLVLGTKNYAKSVRDPNHDEHHLIISQIEYAKSLRKPAVILLECSTSDEDKQIIREALKGMEIIGVFEFEAGNEASMREAVMRMKEAIEVRE